MKSLSVQSVLFIIFCFIFGQSGAQDGLSFIENKSQWDARIRYKLELQNGAVFMENNCLTFNFVERRASRHSAAHGGTDSAKHEQKSAIIKGHAYRVNFLNSNILPQLSASRAFSDYNNYLYGSDQQKWATNVKRYEAVEYKNVYQSIDLKLYSKENCLVYDFIVNAGGDISKIRLKYEGVDNVQIKDGNLIVKTSINEIVELKPFAFQEVYNDKQEISCKYVLKNNILTFSFPDGYDASKQLIIDPTLVFSTYSGSVADNWGFTATFDNDGNVYSGGIVDGVGYPVNLGAYQTSWAGNWDVGIIKYNPTGTQRLFATYLGGAGMELPHSLIVNSLNQLVVFGTTGSTNFPTSTNAYDRTFNGGISFNYDGLQFDGGFDIYVSKFSADGINLLASTYIGGSNNDGLNFRQNIEQYTMCGNDSLYFNYGDGARGEVIVDAQNNIYIGSCTFSSDFPVTSNSFQHNYGGKEDGVVFKFDSELHSLVWSSYLGGSQDDAIYSVDVNSNYNLYVSGGTNSNDFPTKNDAYQHTRAGGGADGFVSYISQDGIELISSSFFGSAQYDQSYFVRTDSEQNVYIFGQTKATGSTLIYNANYANPNSGQFIAKFNPTLTQLIWSTVFGTGSGKPNISPTAFAVDICGRIYLSGSGREWPNIINNLTGQVQYWSTIEGTKGMPITADAYQTTTDGMDFYIMVLDLDATDLEYATYFGELQNSSACGYAGHDHVDGGTSRFDKFGNIFQSVCGSCGSCQDFPTFPNPGAWSNTNNSNNCNNATFKISLTADIVLAGFNAPQAQCAPATITFTNTTRTPNANTTYLWDFGDGTTSTLESPTHTYTTSGVYTVTLTATNLSSCNQVSVFTKDITILDNENNALPPVEICQGSNIQIGIDPNGMPSVPFVWTPTNGLSNTLVVNPIASPEVTTTYLLIISNSTCTDTISQTVIIRQPTISLDANDISFVNLCENDSATIQLLDTVGITDIRWTVFENGTILTTNDSSFFGYHFPHAGNYELEIKVRDICPADTMLIPIALEPNPNVNITDTAISCFGEEVVLDAGIHATYLWSDGTTNQSITVNQTGEYWVLVNDTGTCAGTDSDTSMVYYSQLGVPKNNNNWNFGNNAAISFNTSPPTVLTNSAMTTTAGCSSISDNDGNLLFYTNGITVWNRNNLVMNNGTGLKAAANTSQAALIVPNPSNANLYYIFSMDDLAGTDGLQYSVVNMEQDNGNGAIEIKNQIIRPSLTEKLAASYHQNGTDIWIVVHGWNSNAFYAYKIAENGLNLEPVTSSVGSIHGTTDVNSIGCMRISPDGSKLVIASFGNGFVELFDFNNITGEVSNPVTFSGYSMPYGVEFSPDNSKVYFSCRSGAYGNATGKIYQIDLAAQNTVTQVFAGTSMFGDLTLQLGPDNRIYGTKISGTALDVIMNPNAAGVACNFTADALNLGGKTSSNGLPNILYRKGGGIDFQVDNSCQISPVTFSLTDAPNILSVIWDFGDGSASTELSPTHLYQSAGDYLVTVSAGHVCKSSIFQKLLTISFVSVRLGNDITVCEGTNVTLDAGTNATTYLWNNGSTNQTISVAESGPYWVEVANGSCRQSDTTNVTINAIPPLPVCNDTTIYIATTATLHTENIGIVDWYDAPTGGNLIWTGPIYETPILYATTTYYVQYTSNNCEGPRKPVTVRVYDDQPLTTTASVTINTWCNVLDCNYSGPTIMINEIMMSPAIGDGSIYDIGYYGQDYDAMGEWIELYNPNWCDSVDISCYYLGNNAPDPDISQTQSSGGFVLPSGLVVPPQGFAVIRGREAPPVPDNLLIQNGGKTIEIVVDTNVCLGTGWRLWFPNEGGWFAFYDNNGVPQDAVSWGTEYSDLNGHPCYPTNTGCPSVGALSSYNQIPSTRKKYITTIIDTSGLSFQRIPDAGNWLINSPQNETYGVCNTDCVTPPRNCNGTATANPEHGATPYTYLWNDAQHQATQTATGLCAGTYIVTVTDSLGFAVKDTVTVSDFSFDVNLGNDTSYCGDFARTLEAGTIASHFLWSTGETSQNITVSSPDTYVVVAKTAGGCAATDSIVIQQNPIPYVHLRNDTTICEGDSAVFAVQTNATSFFWQNNSILPTFTARTTGYYWVEASNVCGTVRDSVFLNVRTVEKPNLGADTTLCYGTGLQLNAGDGYTNFLWSDSSTNSVLPISEAGTYWVQVRNYQCVSGDTINIGINPQLFVQQSAQDISCNNLNDGTLNVFASGGSGNFTYTLNDTLTQTSNTFTNLPSAEYQIVVTDQNHCQITTQTIFIGNPALLTILQNTSEISCHNSGNGAITISATGGTGDYLYTVNDGIPQTSNIFNNLTDGIYIVSVTDENGCTAQAPTVTLYNPQQLSFNHLKTNVLCHNQNNGTITINASGGTGEISYILNDTLVQTTNIFENLYAGTYNITIRDANLCISAVTPITIENPAMLSISAEKTDITCHNLQNGQILAHASGGTGTILFSLNNSALQTDSVFNNLSEGTYVITIFDQNNCTLASNPLTINNPDSIITTVAKYDNSCYNSNNGSISVFAGGGVEPFMYQLNSGTPQINNTFTPLAAGNYAVTTIDHNLCQAIDNVEIINPPDINISFSTTNVVCHNGNNGTITVSATGGTGELQYALNGGDYQVSNFFGELSANTYLITVKDENNCVKNSTPANLPNPTPIDVILQVTQIKCYNQSDGSITVSASGGFGGFLYKLNSGTYQNNPIFSNLAAGNYVVSVLDQTGCAKVNDTETLTNPPAIFYTTNSSHLTCHDSNDGIINVVATGGVGTLEYSLNNGNWHTNGNFTQLSAGTYFVTIRDDNACILTLPSIVLNNPGDIALHAANVSYSVSCHGVTDGSISVEASGGTSPYTFSLNGGEPSTNNFFNNLPSGSYIVTATDAHNCKKTSETFIINEPTEVIVQSVQSVNVNCFGKNTGRITVAAYGGTGALRFSLNEQATQSSNIFEGLYAGIYTINVYDSNNCVKHDETVINQQSELLFDATVTDTRCTGECNGTVDVKLTGAVPPYRFVWNDESTSLKKQNCCAGLLTLQVTDNLDCEVSKTFEVKVLHDFPIVDIIAESNQVVIGSTILLSTYYDATYQYIWSPADFLDNATKAQVNATVKATTTFAVTATNSYGCAKSDSINIEVIESHCREPYIFVPNAFTPEQTESGNHILYVRSTEIEEVYFAVYNRWGKPVFETNNINEGWDGTYKGEKLPPAVYVYYLKATCKDKEKLIKKGNVTLIR